MEKKKILRFSCFSPKHLLHLPQLTILLNNYVIMKEEGNNTEQAILEAAEQEFYKKGYAGSKTTEIAKAAGVTHAMLHYYFRTKENLFNKVFLEKAKVLANSFTSKIGPGLTLEETIKTSIEAHFDILAADPTLPLFIYREIFASENGEAICKQTLLPSFKMAIHSLEKLIEEEVVKGTIRPIAAIDLITSAISLNVFIFITSPLIKLLLEEKGEDYQEFLARKRQENVEIILSRLRK